MRHSGRLFNRLTVPLWLEGWERNKYSAHQVTMTLREWELTLFKLLNCLTLIPLTCTGNISARPAQYQNPIDHRCVLLRCSCPAVSSLEASPTPAQ